MVTTGSSGGFILAFLAQFEPGDRVAVASPGYPPYRNILMALGCEPVTIEISAATRWAITVDALLETHRRTPLKGVVVASPANPTGTMIDADHLAALIRACDDAGIRFISDEIYHGLDYTFPAQTAVKFSDSALVINSFSKYFCMTGWRIGWMVVPEALVRAIDRLQQNLAISVPTLSQIAAEAAFDGRDEMEAVKRGYVENRKILTKGLPRAGLEKFLPADGAFYLYADVSRFTNDSFDFAKRMLQETHVAATPGHRLRSRERQPVHPLLLRGLERRHARGGGADREVAEKGLRRTRCLSSMASGRALRAGVPSPCAMPRAARSRKSRNSSPARRCRS